MKLETVQMIPEPALSRDPPRAPYKVLLVDDNRDMVTLVDTYLDDPRIELTVSGNGEQAIQAFKDSAFDLVLMDIQMPVLDGCAATRAIRLWEAHHSLPFTPITALTASNTPDELTRIFAAGCSNYLPKPITKIMLLQTVRQFLTGPPKNALVHSAS